MAKKLSERLRKDENYTVLVDHIIDEVEALESEVKWLTGDYQEFGRITVEAMELQERLAKAQESISDLRDILYEELPTGVVDAFTLIKLINNTIKTLDNIEKALGGDEKCQV